MCVYLYIYFIQCVEKPRKERKKDVYKDAEEETQWGKQSHLKMIVITMAEVNKRERERDRKREREREREQVDCLFTIWFQSES